MLCVQGQLFSKVNIVIIVEIEFVSFFMCLFNCRHLLHFKCYKELPNTVSGRWQGVELQLA